MGHGIRALKETAGIVRLITLFWVYVIVLTVATVGVMTKRGLLRFVHSSRRFGRAIRSVSGSPSGP